MEKYNKAHTRLSELNAHSSHGILPGQGVRRCTDDQFSISDPISRIGSRIGRVLEVIPDRHSESLPESGAMFNGAAHKHGAESASPSSPPRVDRPKMRMISYRASIQWNFNTVGMYALF
jgi:hypothetical protein